MGVEYFLVSDSKGEAYELGKGSWDFTDVHDLRSLSGVVWDVLRPDVRVVTGSGDPRPGLLHGMDVALKIWQFMKAHPDWMMVNDSEHEFYIDVPGSHVPPSVDVRIYRLIGSMYKDVRLHVSNATLPRPGR